MKFLKIPNKGININFDSIRIIEKTAITDEWSDKDIATIKITLKDGQIFEFKGNGDIGIHTIDFSKLIVEI